MAFPEDNPTAGVTCVLGWKLIGKEGGGLVKVLLAVLFTSLASRFQEVISSHCSSQDAKASANGLGKIKLFELEAFK